MLPTQLDFVRKGYTAEIKEFLADIGEKLSKVDPFILDDFNPENSWRFVYVFPRVLTYAERWLIVGELSKAGWGATMQYHNSEVDQLIVYLKIG